MPRIRPLRVDAESPFIGEACALCQASFAEGDKIVICPEDAVRHHAACWEANGRRCAALGCEGKGRLKWRSHTPDDPDEFVESPLVLEGDVLEGEIINPETGYGPSGRRTGAQAWSSSGRGCRRCFIIGSILLLLLCACGTVGFYFLFDMILNQLPSMPTPDLVTPTPFF